MEVSRARIAANFRAVCEAVGPGVEVVPVVKADAYRHGAVEVSRVLEREGARWLAVSSVEEGVALRQAGITARILVMADFLAIERIRALDARGLYDVVQEEDISMCGLAPAVSMLTALRLLGARQAELVRYATSGDLTGDRSEVVGYAGMIFT